METFIARVLAALGEVSSADAGAVKVSAEMLQRTPQNAGNVNKIMKLNNNLIKKCVIVGERVYTRQNMHSHSLY